VSVRDASYLEACVGKKDNRPFGTRQGTRAAFSARFRGTATIGAELLVGVQLADRRRRAAHDRYVPGLLATVPVEAYDTGVARVHAALPARQVVRVRRCTRCVISSSFAAETVPQRLERRSREIDLTISGMA